MAIRLKVEVDSDGKVKLEQIAQATKKLGPASDQAASRWKANFSAMGRDAMYLNTRINETLKSLPMMLGFAGGGLMFAGAIKSGLAFNATLESLKVQYKVIIGDQEKANRIFQETVDFSANTPFQLDEVARARKVLLAFGLESQEDLRLVGDAAAGTGTKIDELAVTMGRLKAGAFGEAFQRLRETGIATPKMLMEVGLVFDKQGSFKGSAEKAVAGVQEIIRRKFGGMMDEMSRTWQGVTSNLIDNWNIFKGALTAGIFEKLKPQMLELSNWLKQAVDSGKVKEIGNKLADWTQKAIDFGKAIARNKDLIVNLVVAFGTLKVAIDLTTLALSAMNLAAKVNLWVLLASVIVSLGAVLYANREKVAGATRAFEIMGGVIRALYITISEIGYILAKTLEMLWQMGTAVVTFTALVATRGISNFGDTMKQSFGKVSVNIVDVAIQSGKRVGGAWADAFSRAGSTGPSLLRDYLDQQTKMMDEWAGRYRDPSWTGKKDTGGAGDNGDDNGPKKLGAGTEVSTWVNAWRSLAGYYQGWLNEKQKLDETAAAWKARLDEKAGNDLLVMNEKTSDDLLNRVETFAEKYGEIMGGALASATDMISVGIADTFQAMLWEAKSFKSATAEIWRGVRQQFTQMLADMLAKWITTQLAMMAFNIFTGNIFGGGGGKDIGNIVKRTGGPVQSFAGGGMVRGTGTGNEDNVVAFLSKREFVQPAPAVQKYGTEFMEQVRTGTYDPRGGGASFTFNVHGAPDLRAEIERTIVPELERLTRQRRYRS